MDVNLQMNEGVAYDGDRTTEWMAGALSMCQCPRCGSGALRMNDAQVRCSGCLVVVAQSLAGENRIAWTSAAEADPREIAKYDSWAERQDSSSPTVVEGGMDSWMRHSAVHRWITAQCPELRQLNGTRVLDIGGSCKDSWRFVSAGAARLDQLDVSPGSQALGRRRLVNFLPAGSWRECVWFHTATAESLPFQADTFDLVFSRATIHHTRRPDSLKEIARVLKPGGAFVMIEPRLPEAARIVMVAARWLRRVDRGTDDPLRTRELRALRDHFRDVRWHFHGIVAGYWSSIATGPSGRTKQRMHRFDSVLGRVPGLGSLIGTTCAVVARK